MSNFLKAFLSFGLATSIEKLLGFIILPIYTRYFNTTEYGVIDMVSSILQVSCIFGLLQLETALQRYYYECDGVKRKLLISTIYFWIILFSLFIGVIIFIISPWLSNVLFGSDTYISLIRIISFQLPLSNISMLGLVLLRFDKQNVKFLIVICVKVVASLLFVYIFVINFKIGLNGVFFAQVSALFLSTMLVTYYVKENFVFQVSKIFTFNSFKYALPQFPARIGSVALGQANRFFMLGYLSLSIIGIYSVSLKLASTIQLVNTAFILAWTPFMSALFKNKNNKKIFASVFPLVACVTFLCVCIITLFSQEMIKLLTTKDFYDAYKYVGGLALFYALYIVKETIDVGPKITEKTKYLSLTFFLSVVVNLFSLYFFIQHFELRGVIFSMIITNLFLVLMSWFMSNRLYYIPYSIPSFIILFTPALMLSVLIMFYEWTLVSRLAMLIACLFFYGVFLKIFYEKLKIVNAKI